MNRKRRNQKLEKKTCKIACDQKEENKIIHFIQILHRTNERAKSHVCFNSSATCKWKHSPLPHRNYWAEWIKVGELQHQSPNNHLFVNYQKGPCMQKPKPTAKEKD